ncbi:GNAT family N-acetyltransferase [Sphingomonas sp. M1-B02]|uniref:GNAT family N-acetyltransferase n=1 Tax=Sphingomonas sp. M1-B02 TaxID=3114300 RepID=UPI0022402AEE|nr:GNAT family N-acetyltransferase [Sphingomonas sp. S6-11]UZK66104.1 GNAT family N-acetyltransferase [Sphingomonas sp. S6-11]
MSPYQIASSRTDTDRNDAAVLFARYAESLDVDLAYQGFDAELASLPGDYAPPRGALLLARAPDGAAIGCVALRPAARDGCCEMKRLFLLPSARGCGLGEALTAAIVAEARRLEYRALLLDTLASMTTAIRLYEKLGFRRIEPYYAPTPPGTLFMALNL